MTAFALGLVLGAAFIHASWNFLAKRAGGGAAFVWLFAALSAIFYAPLAVIIYLWQRPYLGPLQVAFMAGSALIHLAYFLILPMTLRFLIGLQQASMTPMITASDYFGFTIMMMLVFGAVFELPLVIVALAALGLVTPKMLRGTRRAAIVIIVAIACIITPGDLIVTSAALAVPMYLLYEASILVSGILYRRRERRIAPNAPEPSGAQAPQNA